MTVIARKSDGFCTQATSPALLPRDSGTGGGQRVTLSASVGNRGANRPDDTRKIQRALNRVPPDQGGAVPPLVEDGKCGSKTIKAIHGYQLHHFGWSGADGLVEPGKRTIAKLNEDTGAISFPDMTPVVRLTQAWVLACLRHLDLVGAVLDKEEPAPGGPFQIVILDRAERMRLANKHFDLGRFPNKREMFGLIRGTYAKMRTVFERPGGLWGVATFDKDPLNRAVQAYAVGGGFFHPGEHVFVEGKKIRADAVYLCVRFANELHEDNRRAFVVIHELAHFVGHPRPIGDHAHNKQGEKIRTMPSNLKVINAETYANFAWEVVNGDEAPIF
jgi:hypothetical protein